jgi:D-threo-aldose 1-dehydrogenase
VNHSTTQLNLPKVIFGTSSLGNLFEIVPEEEKFNIVQEVMSKARGIAVFDSAGKYGAGLALESLGNSLRQLKVSPQDVIISNKLGWVRTPLKSDEPAFEPGVWKGLKYDAVQKISYDGILECFEQGNELLNGYIPQMVSVHDPDEYLAQATDEVHAAKLYRDILAAYEALFDLKRQGSVSAVGVGAKDWRSIQKISQDVPLDWVMIANSLTIKNHPPQLLSFIATLKSKGIFIINSAVFHSGFLVGGDYFNYRLTESPSDDALFQWRKNFFEVCKSFKIAPAAACVQFAMNIPGVDSIALSTTSSQRVKENFELAEKKLPGKFWQALKDEHLIQAAFIG